MRKERDGLLYGPYERPEKMELCYDWYDDGPPQGNSLRQQVIYMCEKSGLHHDRPLSMGYAFIVRSLDSFSPDDMV